jgi:cell division initiation protein
MKMTPLDIRQKRFERQMRGYSQREVEGFLELTASEFEEVVKENIALKEEHKRTLARLEHYFEREKALQETMVTAQRISEDVKATARKEAEVMLAEAELQGDKIVAGANARLVELVGEISELKRQRVQFESQLGSIIDSHHKLLETFKSSAPEVSFLLQKKSSGNDVG